MLHLDVTHVACAVLVLHDLHLIHTDLKPENILLVHNNYRLAVVPVPGKASGCRVDTQWDVIRFPFIAECSTTDETDTSVHGYSPHRFWFCDVRGRVSLNRCLDASLSSTGNHPWCASFVREVHHCLRELCCKGLGWSYPCDAYSLGCILVEFYTGVALYQTHDNLEHLAMMEAVMGKMPDRFARAGARSKPEFFKDGSRLDWPKPKASRQSKKDVRATKSLVVILHLRILLSFAQPHLLSGCYTTQRPDQQTFFGSREAIACF